MLAQSESSLAKIERKRSKLKDLKDYCQKELTKREALEQEFSLIEKETAEQVRQEMQAQLDAKDSKVESFKQELEADAMEQITALETQLLKSKELLQKAQGEVEGLKAQKKEQSIKMAKQSKENLMKNKEDTKVLKQA